ncbi:MAG: hypothetical protein V1773_17895 [bacterium]
MNKKTTIAAIDIGTNSIHMIIANVDDDGNIDLIHRKREVVRLGDSTFGVLGRLSAESMDKAINTLKKYLSVAIIYKAVVLTCATSAVREAANGEEFINKIKDEINLDVQIINGEDEAYLIYSGISKALNLENHLIMAFDIGGGSTEFIVGNHKEILFSKSIPIGAVRQSKMFFNDFVLTPQNINQCRNYVKQVLHNEVFEQINMYKIEKYAGASGTIYSTYLMIEKKEAGVYLESINGGIIKSKNLFKLENEILSKNTKEERLNLKGLENKRADIFPAGIIILSEIFRTFNIEQIVLSTYAMREGMIINYAKTNKVS